MATDPFRQFANPEDVVSARSSLLGLTGGSPATSQIEIPTAPPTMMTQSSQDGTGTPFLGLGGGLGLADGGGGGDASMNPLAAIGLALSSAAAGVKGDFLLPIVMMQNQQQAAAAKQKNRLDRVNTTLSVLDRAYKMKLPLAQRKELGQQVDQQLPGLGRLFEFPEQDYSQLREALGKNAKDLAGIIAATPDELLDSIVKGVVESKLKIETKTAIETSTPGGILAQQQAAADLDKTKVETDVLREKLKALPKDRDLEKQKLEAEIANLQSQAEARQDDVRYGKVVSKMLDKGLAALTPEELRLYNDKTGDPEAKRLRIDIAVERLRMAEENQVVGIMAGLIKNGVLNAEDQTTLLQRIGEIGKIQTEKRESTIRDAINDAFKAFGAPPPIQPGLQLKQGAAAPATSDLPPIGPKGQRIRDTQTGKFYKSDGTQWVPE